MGDQAPFPPELASRAGPQARLTTLQKAEFIRSVEVFSQLTVEELYRFAWIAREVDFAAGEVIFREDDLGDDFYVVVQGKVECASRSGDDREVVESGQSFGLYSVLTREPRSATATALEDTFGISLGAEDLFSLLSNNMEIVVSIFKHFTKKLGPSLRF